MSTTPRKLRRALTTGALVVGTALGAAGIATAATSSGSSSTTTAPPASGSTGTAPAPRNGAPPAGVDPATMTHGPNETLLTGSDLEKAEAAATAAEPGATVIRAETDSSGTSPYEVHMKKADGTDVTVQLNSDFTVKSTESGFGPGAGGPHGGPGGPSSSISAPASASTSA